MAEATDILNWLSRLFAGGETVEDYNAKMDALTPEPYRSQREAYIRAQQADTATNSPLLPTPGLMSLRQLSQRPDLASLRANIEAKQQLPSRTDPDVAKDPSLDYIPITEKPSLSKAKFTLKEKKEPSEIYIQTEDVKGNPITVFSTTGELKTEADFAKALANHDEGTPTPGFVVLPSGGTQEKVRRGYEAANQRLQQGLPQIGGAIGAVAGTSPLTMLLEKAGVVPRGSTGNQASPMRRAGEATGQFLAEQINTPEKAAMAAGTGVVSRAMLPVVNAANQGLLAPALVNMGIAGAAGGTAAQIGRVLTGGENSPAQTGEDFAIAALSGGLQAATSYFITKFINKGMQEKVAKEVVDTFKKRYPNVNLGNNVMNIAGSSANDIEALTQQMSKGLRGTVDEVRNEIVTTLNQSLPSSLSQGQQVSLRGYIRRLATAQNKQLDSIGNDVDFQDAGALVTQRTQELLDAAKAMFPNVKTLNAQGNLVRASAALEKYNSDLSRFQDGAKVLHYLREAGAQDQFDPLKFAQLIRGRYQSNPGSQLEAVGNILGQGRPLTQMPLPGQPDPISNIGTSLYNSARGMLPSWLRPGRMSPQMPQVPWQARQAPMQPLINFGAQEAGQAAIHSFME